MKKTLVALFLAAMTLPALAQDKKAPEPDYTITGNAGIFSDYRFRGISQSDKDPAIQGGVDFAHKSGVYLGNWNSSVSDWAGTVHGSGIEMDFYGGFKTEVAGVGLDFGAIYYYYPGAKHTTTTLNPVNTREIYLGAGYGPFSVKISRTISDRYFGIGKENDTSLMKSASSSAKGTMYYDLSFSKEIADKTTLKIHAGLLDIANRNTATSTIKDFSVGVSYDLSGWILGLTYADTSGINTSVERTFFTNTNTTGRSVKLYEGAAILSLTKTF
jgi:uncharacterized protein (TIGR02001 family)